MLTRGRCFMNCAATETSARSCEIDALRCLLNTVAERPRRSRLRWNPTDALGARTPNKNAVRFGPRFSVFSWIESRALLNSHAALRPAEHESGGEPDEAQRRRLGREGVGHG